MEGEVRYSRDEGKRREGMGEEERVFRNERIREDFFGSGERERIEWWGRGENALVRIDGDKSSNFINFRDKVVRKPIGGQGGGLKVSRNICLL